MIKERTITQKYIVCDYCGEEIDDHSSISIDYKNGLKTKHFHSMYAGGSKGRVKTTCYDLFKKDETEKRGVESQSR